MGGGESRKPTKNQGEIQGTRKPSVLWISAPKTRTVQCTLGFRALVLADFLMVCEQKNQGGRLCVSSIGGLFPRF
jgi:hypothetical protein